MSGHATPDRRGGSRRGATEKSPRSHGELLLGSPRRHGGTESAFWDRHGAHGERGELVLGPPRRHGEHRELVLGSPREARRTESSFWDATEARRTRRASFGTPRGTENTEGSWDRHGGTENTRGSGIASDTQRQQRNAPREMASDIIRRMAIRVMHFGLGPIGAAVVRSRWRRAAGSGGGRDRYRSREGGQGSRRSDGADDEIGRQGNGRRAQGDQGGKAGCRGAVHQFIAQEGLAADGRSPEAQGADRLDDGGAGVSGSSHMALAARDRQALLGRRRSPCWGRASTRASRWTHCRSRSPASAPVSKPSRSTGFRTRDRAGCRSSRRSARGLTPAQFQASVDAGSRAARGPHRIDRDDCRRDGLDARSRDRPDQAAGGRRADRQPVPDRAGRARSAG